MGLLIIVFNHVSKLVGECCYCRHSYNIWMLLL